MEFKNTLLWISIIIIIGFTAYFIIKINRWKKNNSFTENKSTMDAYPSILSTLGVLGTFIGIAVGLKEFNTGHIDTSITTLLDGLKTAFWTSIVGMICSMIVSSIIRKTDDKINENTPTSDDAATTRICNAVEALERVVRDQNRAQTAFYGSMSSLIDSLGKELNNACTSLSTITNNSISHVSMLETQTKQIDKQVKILDTQQQLLGDISKLTDKNIDSVREQTELVSQQIGINQENLDETKKFSQVLRGEVAEMTDHMDKTNILLENKFNEFAELLKKSNTEALVEVMKNVTNEFQKQMNELINKLIQENFEELNNSVRQMNTWQKEHKEMVAELTDKYRKMNESFGTTSGVLQNVTTNTNKLSGDSGALAKLVHELQSVMIEDTKFKELTTNLSHAAETTSSSMEKFDESQKSLNDWVRKQKNFVDGVVMLTEKLDDLKKIKSYGEEFWSGTRKSMEENVGIIKQGTNNLNSQILEINQEFYDRLSTTLSALDNCIQAVIKNDR